MEYTLMAYFEVDDVESIKKEFENEIADEIIFSDNGSLLHWCSEYNAIKCLNFLLTKENIAKKIDFVDKQQGASALHWAAQSGNTECIKILLKNGSNINLKDLGDETALHWAALNGKSEALKYLIDSGIDLNAQSKESKYTALHYTALNQHCECVGVLLNAKCDQNKRDSEGLLAVDLANETKNHKLMDYFNPEKMDLFLTINSLKESNALLRSQLEDKTRESEEAKNKLHKFIVDYSSLEQTEIKKTQEHGNLEKEFKEYKENATKESEEQKDTILRLQLAFEKITQEIISVASKYEDKEKECEQLIDESRQHQFHIKILKEQIQELQEKALTPQIVEMPVNLIGKVIVSEMEMESFKKSYKQLDEIISFATTALSDSKKNFDHFFNVMEKSKMDPKKEKIETKTDKN